MDGLVPEIGDYVEVLIDGESKSGGNIRARTPKGDIQIPNGEEGEVITVRITRNSGCFQGEIVEPPEDEEVHSLVDYHRDLNNLDEDPEKPDRKEKWIQSRKGGNDKEAVKKWHLKAKKESDDKEEDEKESPFSDEVVGSKNDLL